MKNIISSIKPVILVGAAVITMGCAGYTAYTAHEVKEQQVKIAEVQRQQEAAAMAQQGVSAVKLQKEMIYQMKEFQKQLMLNEQRMDAVKESYYKKLDKGAE